jgi:hypothetical protein
LRLSVLLRLAVLLWLTVLRLLRIGRFSALLLCVRRLLRILRSSLSVLRLGRVGVGLLSPRRHRHKQNKCCSDREFPEAEKRRPTTGLQESRHAFGYSVDHLPPAFRVSPQSSSETSAHLPGGSLMRNNAQPLRGRVVSSNPVNTLKFRGGGH